jgi:hypothetical protein
MRPRLSILISVCVGLILASGSIDSAAGHVGPPGSANPRAASQDTPPQPFTGPGGEHGMAGRRGSVDVRKLSTLPRSPDQTFHIPLLGRGPASSTPKAPGPAPLVVSPPSPSLATPNTSGPAAKTGFAGLAESSNTWTNREPPDPWVAVGPDTIIQMVNVSMEMSNRAGNGGTAVSLPSFFELPNPDLAQDSDGRVIYDSLHGRWLATELSWDCIPNAQAQFGTGYVDFAVSRTADPSGLWDVYYISYPDFLPDFPAPGTSTDKIGLASNFFAMGSGGAGNACLDNLTFDSAHITIMDWSDLLNGNSVSVRGDTLDGFSPRFAVQVPATSPKLNLVMESADLGVAFADITGTVAAANLAYERYDVSTDLTDQGVVAGFLDPPHQPEQPGPDPISQAVDSRPTDAIWQANRLEFVSTYPCTPSGDSMPRDCVRVTELDTGKVSATVAPSLRQDFLVGETAKDDFMGGIGLSGDGTLYVGWTRSSDADNPSSYSAHQSLADPKRSLSPKELLDAGAIPSIEERWGDYVGIAQDPQVPSRVWDGNQTVAADGTWATQITPLQSPATTYVPITPVRVLDSRHGTGLTGKFKTSVARTWQVTGVGGIPAGAVAVTGNMTVTGQTGAGYVSVTPTATNVPQSSSLNFPVGDVRANNVTVSLSTSGSLSAVYKSAPGTTADLVFDVTGYFVANDAGTMLHPLAPVRVLDTRTSRGLTGHFVNGVPRTLVIGGTWSIPTTATSIVGNLTVTGQTGPGYLSVTKLPTATPGTSTLNFPLGDTRANGLVAPLSGTGALSIVFKSSTAGATAQVILDVTGFFVTGPGGLRFVPLNPGRIMDTRPGVVLSGLTGTFAANNSRQLVVDGHWGVPLSARAVVGNLTVTGQTGGGYISVTPGAPPPNPATSTLNFPLGDTRANGLVTPLDGSGRTYLVYVSVSLRRANLILDLAGYYE